MKDGRKVKIPSTVCECGKPVVFLNNRKTFVCTRCDTKWRLIVKVQKIEKKIK
jgi:hypothetical protein